MKENNKIKDYNIPQGRETIAEHVRIFCGAGGVNAEQVFTQILDSTEIPR